MGLMTGSGCLSRFMGPVFVSYVYTRLGTLWTFGITTSIMVVSMVWLLLFQGRLVVPEEQEDLRQRANGKVAVDDPERPGQTDEDVVEEATEDVAEDAEAVRLQSIKTDKG